MYNMDDQDIVPPTPESFRRKGRDDRDSDDDDQTKDRTKEKNHVTDDNYEMSMNQVFGHSQFRPTYRGPPPEDKYEQQRPQAPNTDRYGAHPSHVDRDRQHETYEDDHHPRYVRAGQNKHGRPDLGFYQEDAIDPPYPQEPTYRPKDNFWGPPPEIGFNPYKKEEPPRPNPGWYLMMRFHKDGESQVRHALIMCQKHIEEDGGRILGIARPSGIIIVEGGDAWVTFGRMRHYGNHLEVQQNPKEQKTNYCVLVIYYPSLSRAIQWFDRDGFYKQRDFPPPYATDCIALPVHGSADTRFMKTLSLTEYIKITYPEYFRDFFSTPTKYLMEKKFRAMPYIVKTSSVPVDSSDVKLRVARHLRGSWIKRNSVITLSLFESLKEAIRYYTDEEYMKAKDCQDKVSNPTTILMDLEDWKPLQHQRIA